MRHLRLCALNCVRVLVKVGWHLVRSKVWTNDDDDDNDDRCATHFMYIQKYECTYIYVLYIHTYTFSICMHTCSLLPFFSQPNQIHVNYEQQNKGEREKKRPWLLNIFLNFNPQFVNQFRIKIKQNNCNFDMKR